MLLLNPRHSVEETNSHGGRKVSLIHLVDSLSAKSPWKRSRCPVLALGTRGTELVTTSGITVDGSCRSSRHHEFQKIDSKVSCKHFSFLLLSLQMPLKLGCLQGEPNFMPPASGWISKSPVIFCSKLRPCWSQWTWLFAELGFLLAEVITRDVVTSQYPITYLSRSKQALTTGLGHVNGFISYYKGTSSSLSSSPHHLSSSLRDSNGTVINTFTFSVLLPPVQISITQSDKEKMKLQSVRLQVFSLMIGAVFKTL